MVLKDLVLDAAGEETWATILKKASHVEDAPLLEPKMFDDKLTFNLIQAAREVLKLTLAEALHAFGRHFALYALRSGNASFLRAQGATLPAFMANINNVHQQLERDHPAARFPFIEVDYNPEADEATIIYLSARQDCSPVVVGAIEEIGRRLYSVEVFFKPIDVPDEFRVASRDRRAAAWKVHWSPLAGKEEPPVEPLPQEKRISFPMLHRLMVECGKLHCCQENGNQPDMISVPMSVSMASSSKQMELAGKSDMEVKQLLMRGTSASNVAAGWTDPALMDCRPFWGNPQGRGEDYNISETVSCADAFISHSWSKPEDWDRIMGKDVIYADFKATTLATMAKDIALSRSEVDSWGNVTFWVDKCCIPQDLPELKTRCILLIEYFMSQCSRICVIFTWKYLERLWCVFEWASFLVQKEPSAIFLGTEYFVKAETLPLYLDAVRKFSLSNTKCSAESDRRILEKKIAHCYVSTEAFEELVRLTVIALVARSMAFTAGRSSRLRRTFFQPWVELAGELGFNQLAEALETCHPERWRAEAAADLANSPSSMMDRMPSAESSYSQWSASASSSTRLTQGGALYHGVSASKYRQSICEWFQREVSPVLREKRSCAVRGFRRESL